MYLGTNLEVFICKLKLAFYKDLLAPILEYLVINCAITLNLAIYGWISPRPSRNFDLIKRWIGSLMRGVMEFSLGA